MTEAAMPLIGLPKGEHRCWYRHYGRSTEIACIEGEVHLRWFKNGIYARQNLPGGASLLVPEGYWYGYEALTDVALVEEVPSYRENAPYLQHADWKVLGVRWT